MAYTFKVAVRVEKDFRKERLFYITPDPKIYEIHLEKGGERSPFMIGYTNNLLEEVRELFTPKHNVPAFRELAEKLEDPDTKCHLCFYFLTAPNDFRKPIEMASAKLLGKRKTEVEFPHAISDDDLEVLGMDRPFEIEFEGESVEELLYS